MRPRASLPPFLIASVLLHLLLALLLPVGRFSRLAGLAVGQPGGAAPERLPAGGGIEALRLSPFLPLGALRLQVVEVEMSDASEVLAAGVFAPTPAAAVEIPEAEPEPQVPPVPRPPPPVEVSASSGTAAAAGSPEAGGGSGGADQGAVTGGGSDAGMATGAGTGAGTGTVSASGGEGGRVMPPVVVAMSWPKYPAEARDRPSVPIVLAVHVTATGEVDAVKVENASGCSACERAAVASAWQLKFLPATRDGEPIAMWMRFPVTFRRR